MRTTRAFNQHMLTAAFAVLLATTAATAMADDRSDAIRDGQRALSDGGGSYPWYDASADGFVPVLPPPPRRPWNLDWDLIASVLQVLGWLAVALFVGLLIAMLAKAYLRRELGEIETAKPTATPKMTPDTVEALPLGAAAADVDLLAAARKLYEQGDFGRAIVYLFSHQLLELDQHHLLRLAKGKTNRQYLREVRRGAPTNRQLVPLVEQTMLLFERAFFGDRAPTREQFERCWSRLDDFHGQLQVVSEAMS